MIGSGHDRCHQLRLGANQLRGRFEIGSFFGSITGFLAGARKLRRASALRESFRRLGRFLSVPRHNAIITAFGARSPREHFDRNVAAAGVSDWVSVYPGKAEEIANGWTAPIDLLNLNGDQSPASARAAYQGFSPGLKLSGVIALHNSDPQERAPDHDGHYLVAMEEIQPTRYIERQLVGSIMFARGAAKHGV